MVPGRFTWLRVSFSLYHTFVLSITVTVSVLEVSKTLAIENEVDAFDIGRYASAPHELKQDWNKFTKDYFLNRSTLVSVFLLVDASIPPKQIDLDYASWLGQNQV